MTRIINYHSEYEWDINGGNKLLEKIDETGDIAQKKVLGGLSLYTKKGTLN